MHQDGIHLVRPPETRPVVAKPQIKHEIKAKQVGKRPVPSSTITRGELQNFTHCGSTVHSYRKTLL